MNASNGEDLAKIFKSINRQSGESDVEQKFVVPLLYFLGYNDADWESQVFIDKSRLDFLICPKDSIISYIPYLVIEVKAPSKNINHGNWQISQYMQKSESVLGLLTNGYCFRIFYNYKGKIINILEYEQLTLIENYILFYKLLCKTTCLNFYQALHQGEQQLRLKFAKAISKNFAIEDMLEFVQQKNTYIENKKESFATVANEEEKPVSPGFKENQKSMIITVFNNKGGVGKTTMTINLAAALNKLGKRVLLIDIDAQANLTMGLGIDPLNDVEEQGKKDISYLLTDPRITLEETLIRKRWEDVQIDIVPSHIRLSDLEAPLMMLTDVDRVLAKKLKKYRDQYDYIFIDPPPSFGKANAISLMASSAVLIPTQLAPYPIRALEYAINKAIAVDKSRDESLPIIGVAVSMYDRTANKLASNMRERILEVLAKNPESKNVELLPENTWIPQLSIVATTPGKGYPLCFAEFDDELSAREKETAEDAFSCYKNLAKYLISASK